MRPIHTYALMVLLLAGCSQEQADAGLGGQCSDGLDAGYRELNQANADGFGSAVKWSKAASLLGAAKVQEQFAEYQNCIIKVRTARRFLREIRG